MSFHKRIFGKGESDSLVLPEGVRVDEWRFLPQAGVAQSDTGIWVVNFGLNPLQTDVMTTIQQLERGEGGMVVFLVSSKTIGKYSAYSAVQTFFEANSDDWRVDMIVAEPQRDDVRFMQALNDLGIGVYIADGGVGIVEVHGPNGFTIGIPGTPFEKACTDQLPSDSPLSDAMEALLTGGEQGQELFWQIFLRSQIGVHVASRIPDEGNTFTTSDDHKAAVSWTGDERNRPVLLAFADPEVFVRNFGQKFREEHESECNAAISALDLIRTALFRSDGHGIRLNSAIDEVSVVIDRDTLASILE